MRSINSWVGFVRDPNGKHAVLGSDAEGEPTMAAEEGFVLADEVEPVTIDEVPAPVRKRFALEYGRAMAPYIDAMNESEIAEWLRDPNWGEPL